MNPADGPSRERPVPEPSREKPGWFDDAVAGRFRRFDVAVAEGAVPRALGPWLRLLLLLAGDIERNPGPSGVPGRRGATL